MSDDYEHNPGDHEDPLSGPTWLIGILGAVLLSVIVLGLTALFFNAYAEEETVKVLQRDPAEIVNLREAQAARLASTHWDQFEEERALVIPIEQAMEQIAQGN